MSANCSIRLVTAKDIMFVLGLGERQARRILRNIRRSLGKLAGQRITLDEFCGFVGLPVASVRLALDH